MQKMFNWRITRSGGGLRIEGTLVGDDNVPTEDAKLTGIAAVSVGKKTGRIQAMRAGVVIAELETKHLEL